MVWHFYLLKKYIDSVDKMPKHYYKNTNLVLCKKIGKEHENVSDIYTWKKYVWINPNNHLQWAEFDPEYFLHEKFGWFQLITNNGYVQCLQEDKNYCLYFLQLYQNLKLLVRN